MNKIEVTGIVLAGGAGSRMGKDKGLCNFKGKPLTAYAIEVLQPLCGSILISSNNVSDYQRFGYKVIPDIYKDIGPMGGIYSSLTESKTKHNIIISCDTPFLVSSVLEHVLTNSTNFDVVVPRHGNSYIEPLAAYYSKNIINKLSESIISENYKLMDFFNKVVYKSVAVDNIAGFSKMLFKNLNTPNDLLSCQ